MQVIGVGERRYFNGFQEMVIILMKSNGQQFDLPASPEQVGTLLDLMEAASAAPTAPPTPPPAPTQPPGPSKPLSDFAASLLDGDGEEIEEPIRLAHRFGASDDDGSPL